VKRNLSLKLHLFIQPPNKMWVTILLFSHPLLFVDNINLFVLAYSRFVEKEIKSY